MDVDGNDNTPFWGYCEWPGCKEDAIPIWLSGGSPDDADFSLCERHIGAKMNELIVLLRTVIADPIWRSYNMRNTAELHIDKDLYERAVKAAEGL